ncbi:MAG TPA: PhoH family protein [Geothrix sp.]|nr:PhoH family protein [Geothrix sp.]
MVPPSKKKVFVLDTNVLLHDPNSILHFQEHDVVLPIVVIEEVDHFKKDPTEIGRNARAVSRLLDRMRATGSLNTGVPLEGGGSLKVDVAAHNLDLGILSADKNKADNQILACARELLHTCKERVVLVTKDSNLRIKADAIGLQAEDYTTDRVEMDELYTGHKTWDVDPVQIDQLYDGGLRPEPSLELQPNQFLTLIDRTNPSHTALGRYLVGEGMLRPLRRMEAPPWGIKPRNREQQFAMELLLDPSVQVVTLLGKAGTGKTLLAIAAGLQQVVDDEDYDKILVSRPVMPMGRDLGYLPGDIGEKLRPYMQPIYDNLEFIVGANSEARKRTTMTAGQLEEAGYLSVEPLTYIRGRSIPKQYLVVDEAQNLTPHEVKTILTRAGEGTKVIFTGDPHQIDNPYVDASTNGLSFLAEHFKQLDISGHVTLMKGERSKLAELASNLL